MDTKKTPHYYFSHIIGSLQNIRKDIQMTIESYSNMKPDSVICDLDQQSIYQLMMICFTNLHNCEHHLERLSLFLTEKNEKMDDQLKLFGVDHGN